MSRYQSGDFAYGYDRPLQEYFLMKRCDEDFVELVGSLGDKSGTARNMLEAIESNNVEIPDHHRLKIMMDLPF